MTFAVVGSLTLALATLSVPAQAAGRAKAFDFNGDGYADLAVGVPGEKLGRSDGGLVEVIYGSRSAGLVAAKSQAWTLDSHGIKGKVSAGGSFGSAIASGDFDADGYADLAAGDRGGGALGSVHILYGGRSGLTARDQVFSSADVAAHDYWGSTLTAGDFNGDGRSDLAIGADGPLGDPAQKVGALNVLYGSRTGLTANGATRITKDTPGISGRSKVGDAFGYRLAAGDVNRDGRDDLALGTQQGPSTGGGAYVLFGSASGVTAVDDQFFATDTAGLAPSHTTFESLGSAVGLADFDGDGYADVALGDEAAGPPGTAGCGTESGVGCPGAVLVLRGSSHGVLTTGKQLWYLDAPGMPGVATEEDQFGASLATGDLNADGRADLAVGAIGTPVGDGNDEAGAVSVIYGSISGLASSHAQYWTQDAKGLKGHSYGFNYFGAHLRIADFGAGSAGDLAASSVGDGSLDGPAPLAQAGRVQVLYGSPRGVTTRDQLWTQDSPGIAGKREAGDFFAVL